MEHQKDQSSFVSTFSSRLGQALDEYGMTVRTGYGRVNKLAEMFEVTASTASRWLNEGQIPELPMLFKISEVFDRPVGWFLGDPRSPILNVPALGSLLKKLDRQIHFQNEGDAKDVDWIEIKNTAFSPDWNDGDIAIYKPLTSAPQQTGFYLRRHASHLVLCFLEVMDDGLRLTTSLHAPASEYSSENAGAMKIVGKVQQRIARESRTSLSAK